MQITLFFIAYTKKSTSLYLWVLIIRSERVVYKLHFIFLAQVKVTQFFCIWYFSNTKHKWAKKNTGQCYSIELQFTCISSHWQIWEKSKNSLKSDIGWLYPQVFNYVDSPTSLSYSKYFVPAFSLKLENANQQKNTVMFSRVEEKLALNLTYM